MKNMTFCIGLLFCISIINAQPKLSVDKLEVDLGSFYSGASRQGKITLTNIGTDTLWILSVQPQCGCTTIKPPRKYLLPKESDAIEIEFHSTGYHGDVEKHVNIATNDPTSQYIDVKLIAKVTEDLEPQNRNIWFGQIRLDTVAVQTLKYKNVSGKQLLITNVIASTPFLKITWDKKVLNADEILSVDVTLKPLKIGFSNEYFWIETNSKYQPRIETKIPFIGEK